METVAPVADVFSLQIFTLFRNGYQCQDVTTSSMPLRPLSLLDMPSQQGKDWVIIFVRPIEGTCEVLKEAQAVWKICIEELPNWVGKAYVPATSYDSFCTQANNRFQTEQGTLSHKGSGSQDCNYFPQSFETKRTCGAMKYLRVFTETMITRSGKLKLKRAGE